MCGIAGYLSGSDINFSSEAFGAAIGALIHRGPDDLGIFQNSDRRIGLAHTRLSILDLSPLGHQPMFSDDRSVALVFNGEIYNHRELKADLEAKGHIFHGHSDTEVLLHLYLEWDKHGGDLNQTLRLLNGMFSFGLWDANRSALLLVRDSFGVKPLYYTLQNSCLFFASEIKALLPMIHSLGPIDATALHRYVSFLWCPGESTPLRNIKKLNPGELIWAKDGVIFEKAIWHQLPVFYVTKSSMNESEAISGTEHHLQKAVHRQMVADVTVGAFLSGGLDSSSVVAFARQQNPNIRCFTIESAGGADLGTSDDLPYARHVAHHLGVPLEIVQVDPTRIAEDLANMVVQLDEPLADLAPLNVLYISQLAKQCGIKVLLSGAGGDDLFTGYRRHRALLAERYWNWLPDSALQMLASLANTLDQRSAWGRRLRKAFDGAILKGDARLVNYFVWSRRDDLQDLYTNEFRIAIEEAEADAPMMQFLANLPNDLMPLEKMLALEQRFFLADHNLNYTDKMSMAAGVEVRVPFLDLELVEFAQRIPTCYKQRGAQGKWVLKKAMEPYLPKDVIYRPKSGFGVPLRRWIRFELRELLADLLSDESLRQRGLFNSVAVKKLITANDTGKIDASYTLLSLMCIELWCRRFIDQHSKELIFSAHIK